MTIRDKLNRQLRGLHGMFILGLLVYVPGVFLPARYILYLILASYVFIVGAILYMMNGIRCPKCKSSVGNAAFSIGGWFRGTGKMKFCPFCGVDIDTEIE